MSIAGTIRRAGPYATDGAQTSFSFSFKVLNEEDVLVVTTEDGADTELVYETDYTVTLNADQDDSPGGTIETATAYDGPELSIISDAAIEQPTVFTNTGGFYPRVLNDALDRATIFIQQIVEKLTRVPLLPLGTPPIGEYPVVLSDGSFGWSTGTGADAGLRGDLALLTAGKGAALVPQLDDGSASLAARSADTAAALETLAISFPTLALQAEEQTVETAPYIRRAGPTIRGNGGTLRNTNATEINVNDRIGTPLMMGVANIQDTNSLTFYEATGADGWALPLGVGEGANFAVGDMALAKPATEYSYVSGLVTYHVYRDPFQFVVAEVNGDTIVPDRAIPEELLTDTPISVANLDEGLAPHIAGPSVYYHIRGWHLSNLTLKSDKGYGWAYGGILDSTFRDITIEGRNGSSLNAVQDSRFENIRFKSWRKICEFAQGSRNVVVDGVTGTLSDASTKNGGGDDTGPFFVSIGENSSYITYTNFNVSSGPNDAGLGTPAITLSSGHHNVIRNSVFEFPAHTGYGVSITSRAEAGNSNDDCGLENVTLRLPNGQRFLFFGALAAGINRPFVRNCRFFGACSDGYAARLAGTDGELTGTYFEDGKVDFSSAAATGWRVIDNNIPGGITTIAGMSGNTIVGNYLGDGELFSGLTVAAINTLLKNNDIRDNDNAANRRLRAAAYTREVVEQVVELGANTTYGFATFAAGDLAIGDKVFFRSRANAGGVGATNRSARFSVTSDGVKVGASTTVATTVGADLGFEGEFIVLSDTAIAYSYRCGANFYHGQLAVSSLAANGLTVNMEYWVADVADPINVRGARIVAEKPGMVGMPQR